MTVVIAFLAKYWKLIGTALVIAGAFFTGVHYKSLTCEIEKREIVAEYDRVIKAEMDIRYELSLIYEKDVAALKQNSKQVIEMVEVEVIKEVYRDCRLPDSGFNLLNDTVRKLNEKN
jgi:hypothetical protein